MFATTHGISLFYEECGSASAPPVVWLHGMGFSHDLWREQAAAFSSHYRLILTDLRGHGKSGVGDGQYTQKYFLEDVIALLDQLHIWRATWCGLSMGAAIAMRAALDHPERVSGLVLCHTRADNDGYDEIVARERMVMRMKQLGTRRFIESFLKSVFAPQSFETHPEAVQLIRETLQRMPPLSLCGAFLSQSARPNLVPRLFRIKVPTLVIAGELDTLTPPSLSEQIHDAIPGSQLRIISGVAHMSPLENPAEVNTLLTEFLPLTHDHSLGKK